VQGYVFRTNCLLQIFLVAKANHSGGFMASFMALITITHQYFEIEKNEWSNIV
jgi:hypothetical protein